MVNVKSSFFNTLIIKFVLINNILCYNLMTFWQWPKVKPISNSSGFNDFKSVNNYILKYKDYNIKLNDIIALL